MNIQQTQFNANQEDETTIVENIVSRAKSAMESFENDSQSRVDEAVTALAWSIYKPDNAKQLAELAVEDTGLGNVQSKIIKNTRKTFGTLRDLLRAKTVGIISEQPELGLVQYGKPVGVVGAVCPSTNPAATPVNKAMMAVKGGNAVIIAPSPAGAHTTAKTVDLMRNELKKSSHPQDLVQILPQPVTKELTEQLVKQVDLAVVTGSQNNVSRAMRSGTVTIGVGAGNVPVIIDSSADLADAAQKITASKVFDNSTSCSSENSLIIMSDVYEEAISELENVGGWRCDNHQKELIRKTLWVEGKLNRKVIAKDASVTAKLVGLPTETLNKKFFMVEESQVDGKHSFADEKLSLILTIYRAESFSEAQHIVNSVLNVTGLGHSVGIHTNKIGNAHKLAENTKVVRVLVNQAHTFGNGGSFENCLPFTLTMGGGTWAGNTISENLNYKHFINITHLVTTIEEDKPTEDELFGDYWSKYGK